MTCSRRLQAFLSANAEKKMKELSMVEKYIKLALQTAEDQASDTPHRPPHGEGGGPSRGQPAPPTPTVDAPPGCDCRKCLRWRRQLQEHQRIQAEDQAKDTPYRPPHGEGGGSSRGQPAPPTPTVDAPRGCDCRKCGRWRRQLKDHQLIEAFCLQRQVQIHQLYNNREKPHTCGQSGRSFTRPSTLKVHQRIHSGEKPHTCDQCGRSFTRSSTLKVHQHIHSGEKPHTCDQCGRSFTQPSTLKVHQRIHSGEKPYTCGQCGKSFTHTSNLKVHQRIHSGEKPYTCGQCGRSFSQLGSLKKHQKVHQKEALPLPASS